ncbi:MAG: dihydrolipoyl dehydrogenase [Clostridiales bacterium]|nr:dihydrolipoyl dehydrogenase [Clostridiales bacterium]
MTDLLIIGAGPGGYVAAIRAAQLGMNVTVVEKSFCGGTCLNIGCIPTKTLYKDAQIMNYFSHSELYGIEVDKGAYRLNFDKVQAEKKKVVDTLVGGVKALLRANKVKLIMGTAKILAPGKVEVTKEDGSKEVIETAKILIATGSKNAAPPVKGLDLPGVITSTEALEMREVPGRIVVIGGGVIGMEFVGIYNAFGSEVTVVEFLPKIMPPMDDEISKRTQTLFEGKGVKFMLSTACQSIEQNGDSLRVTVKSGDAVSTIDCDQVLVSTGRVIETEGLGLEEVGVDFDRKGIKVDENYETNVKGIYAIGDAIGGTMLAHVASEEGKVCVERMNGESTFVDYDLIPSAVFTFPEVASIGVTEQALKEKGTPYKAAKFQYQGNGKALSMHDSEGMVKVIASEDLSRILGVHMVGPNSSDLLTEAAADMYSMLTVQEAASAMHGHPTLSEAYEEALTSLLGCGIHSMPKKKK